MLHEVVHKEVFLHWEYLKEHSYWKHCKPGDSDILSHDWEIGMRLNYMKLFIHEYRLQVIVSSGLTAEPISWFIILKIMIHCVWSQVIMVIN